MRMCVCMYSLYGVKKRFFSFFFFVTGGEVTNK